MSISQVPSDGLGFQLNHAEQELGGKYILIETSAAMPSVRRKPREWEIRWAAGFGASSFIPLQATDAVYHFSEGIDSLLNGQRFGIRVRIVTVEGLTGTPVTQDWIKADSSASEVNTPVQTIAGTPSKRADRKLKLARVHAWFDAQEKLYGRRKRLPWRPKPERKLKRNRSG